MDRRCTLARCRRTRRLIRLLLTATTASRFLSGERQQRAASSASDWSSTPSESPVPSATVLLFNARASYAQTGLVPVVRHHHAAPPSLYGHPPTLPPHLAVIVRYILHLFTSDGTARISSMHYNGAGDWLKPTECIQDKALIISVFVPSELATCSTVGSAAS
jgi:hypothetical protein